MLAGSATNEAEKLFSQARTRRMRYSRDAKAGADERDSGSNISTSAADDEDRMTAAS